MKSGLEPGVSREIKVTVTEDMCPAFDGTVVHRCLSTWSLVHQMEIAARRVLVDFLDDDEEGIGTHVSCDHLAPCLVGRQVVVRATLMEVVHRKAVCEVTAWDGARLLARGRQVQAVFNKDHLRRLIERS